MCNGQLVSIQQNQALFALLGTTYGGDGVSTFGLPDLRGRVPLHIDTGFTQGQRAGEETVTLLSTHMPAHRHTVVANSAADTGAPSASTIPGGGGAAGYGPSVDTSMNAQIIGQAGGNVPHNNMQPYLVVNICICVSGIFPSRN